MVEHADFKVGVEIDGITHRVYVLKRPHVDAFLSAMAKLYECVLFTASLAKVSSPPCYAYGCQLTHLLQQTFTFSTCYQTAIRVDDREFLRD